MNSAQVVETSVITTDNSPSQDYTHPDDQTALFHVTPGFKPFTVRTEHSATGAEHGQQKLNRMMHLTTHASYSLDWCYDSGYSSNVIYTI